ncbi:D-alanyl-D-alanine carboxypeptidase (penicillin-binding protein 5/6) [Desulforamulus putei DSM 12395]|uniref:serine-type D-Ala-D-Ala carboxypeptidase n=1 Tax=Desulforamulus putei DSM 12395 TaxID=1121429 RepID=A0A1M5AF85_9FIRM|nr:D-alanyl-D-alanine carboxypeptidase family protein [Desulforamulus putei]SHF28951.1 D-alanyl-D-alanine carboxypeptidase (penicillin-binding protein 5/6) [Desulforamulus putei DSM 12395]
MKRKFKFILISLVCLLLSLTLCLSSAMAVPAAQNPAKTRQSEGSQGPKPAPKDSVGSKSSSSSQLETTAETAVLMDYSSGQILLDKNMHQSRPMASVTKLMTMLLICEAEAQGKIKMTDKVVISEHAASMGGSQIFLEPGEEMTAKELLISIATGSANDASVAMAEQVAGSEEAFVAMMNDKVKEMGLKNTHFSNPTGLPVDNHYTSAYDMAQILRECLRYPLFREVSSIYEYDLRGGEFKLWNTNKLLKWYPGADAGKTGWTNEASYCLAASAKRDGLRLVSVVLGCPMPRTHFQETIKLFNYGFARYKAVNLAEAGQVVKEIAVGKGEIDKVKVITKDPVGLVVPKGQEKTVQGKMNLPDMLDAPVKKGQVIGNYVLTKDGREVLKVDLVAARDVKKASPVQLLNDMLDRVYSLD